MLTCEFNSWRIYILNLRTIWCRTWARTWSCCPGDIGPKLKGSDLEDLIRRFDVDLWLHGHTHHNVDYRVGDTRVVSNQRGYPDQPVPGFVVRGHRTYDFPAPYFLAQIDNTRKGLAA